MWVYTITLNEKVSSGVIKQDWLDTFAGSVGGRGVLQAGYFAIVTTVAATPSYADFEAESYVESMEGEFELPDPGDAAWDPVYEFSNAFGGVQFN